VTPREVVTRAIEFDNPPRLPINGFGEESDVITVDFKHIKLPGAPSDENVDEWLCRWGKTDQPNMGQVIAHPLEDLAGMKDFPWPDGCDGRRFAELPGKLDEIAADPLRRDKYICGYIFMLLWERMQTVHGFANCMIDLMDDRAEIHELADRIVEFHVAIIRGMCRASDGRLQGFWFTEDWGTQRDLHISPELWRSFFFPRYKKLFGVMHEHGCHVWMHSCGKINKAIGGLIEAGLNVINMQQPLTNGIDEIARDFAGRICFESLCDIQRTLPTGDRRAITAQAEKLLRSWGTPAGGFVLGDYGDEDAIGADLQTKDFMLDEFRRLDPWANGW